MSHFTKVKTKIVDAAYLKRALGELNLGFEEGKVKIRGYMGKKMEVDIRIKTPEGYDIGFKKAGDAFEVIADWDMITSVSQEVFVGEVMRTYAAIVVKDQLQLDSFQAVEEVRQGQTVQLTMRRI